MTKLLRLQCSRCSKWFLETQVEIDEKRGVVTCQFCKRILDKLKLRADEYAREKDRTESFLMKIKRKMGR